MKYRDDAPVKLLPPSCRDRPRRPVNVDLPEAAHLVPQSLVTQLTQLAPYWRWALRSCTQSTVVHPARCAPVSRRPRRLHRCPRTRVDGASGARPQGRATTYTGATKFLASCNTGRTVALRAQTRATIATSDVQYARPRHTHTTTSHKPHSKTLEHNSQQHQTKKKETKKSDSNRLRPLPPQRHRATHGSLLQEDCQGPKVVGGGGSYPNRRHILGCNRLGKCGGGTSTAAATASAATPSPRGTCGACVANVAIVLLIIKVEKVQVVPPRCGVLSYSSWVKGCRVGIHGEDAGAGRQAQVGVGGKHRQLAARHRVRPAKDEVMTREKKPRQETDHTYHPRTAGPSVTTNRRSVPAQRGNTSNPADKKNGMLVAVPANARSSIAPRMDTLSGISAPPHHKGLQQTAATRGRPRTELHQRATVDDAAT